MNIRDHFCLSRHLLPAIPLYPRQQSWKCLHILNRQYTEFHITNFGVAGSLGRKPRFFSPLRFDVQTNSDDKTQKIKLYSVRALKRYLNEKNLIHGRVMATISKFSPQIFETYFRWLATVQSLKIRYYPPVNDVVNTDVYAHGELEPQLTGLTELQNSLLIKIQQHFGLTGPLLTQRRLKIVVSACSFVLKQIFVT